jgi:pimeloyl-ACP methyl ester carboxylesterase
MHLLAPWIPPSQMLTASVNHEPAPVTSLPMSQRLLRSLPTTFLKAANSSWFSMTSTSLTTSIQRSPKRGGTNKRQSIGGENSPGMPRPSTHPAVPSHTTGRPAGGPGLTINTELAAKDADVGPSMLTPASDTEGALSASLATATDHAVDAGRQVEYDARLTQAIWTAATTGANPAVDLLVCLERVHDIGFRYQDVTKPVMIYHGAHDTRVPVENVRWLGATMHSADVRVLEEEGHGLMANPVVMGDVLSTISMEWAEWLAVTRSGKGPAR